MNGRPDGIKMTQFCGRSQEFVYVCNFVVGYVVGYLLTISENTFVFVRTALSEHEVDKHPLRSGFVPTGCTETQIHYMAMVLGVF